MSFLHLSKRCCFDLPLHLMSLSSLPRPILRFKSRVHIIFSSKSPAFEVSSWFELKFGRRMSSSTNPISSSVSGNWRRRGRDRGRRIPKTCRCGEASVMRTFGTVENLGRLFHCCPLGSKGDKFYLFQWTDECLVDEIEDLNAMTSEMKGDNSELRAAVLGFEKELESMKKKMCCLKIVMVCGFGMVALCFYFFA